MNDHKNSTGERQTLQAADGFSLTTYRFRPPGQAQARLVVAGATGVPQGFYRRFAAFAASRGFDVLTLDYRGIGESRPASDAEFQPDYRDWARLDLAAAIEAHHVSDLPLFLVGHSYGGHAIGLLPNHTRIAAAYTFGTGAGWHGWMPWRARWQARFLWRVLGPLLTWRHGHLPGRLLGLGENLPLSIYRQWRRWCSYPRYFFDDPALPGLVDAFAAVRLPLIAANATDDDWALPRSRNVFFAHYSRAPLIGLDIRPADLGLRQIGHMGYFRASCQALWAPALDWLLQQGGDRPPAADAACPQSPGSAAPHSPMTADPA